MAHRKYPIEAPWREAAVIALSAAVLILVSAAAVFFSVFALRLCGAQSLHHVRYRRAVEPVRRFDSPRRFAMGRKDGACATRVDAKQGYLLAKPRLVFFLLGETARAKNHGLNGYERDTTPRMAAAGGHYFPDTEACSTTTAISVPLHVFRFWPGRLQPRRRGLAHETLIDVLLRRACRCGGATTTPVASVCDKADAIDSPAPPIHAGVPRPRIASTKSCSMGWKKNSRLSRAIHSSCYI